MKEQCWALTFYQPFDGRLYQPFDDRLYQPFHGRQIELSLPLVRRVQARYTLWNLKREL
jgi:hypothetical protein